MSKISTIEKRQILEADDEKAVQSSCTIQLDRVFSILHANALKAAQAAAKNDKIIIENTAVEGSDENSAKFHGPGEHMIIVRAEGENIDIDKPAAFKIIQKYVEFFVGPDVSKGISEKDIQVLPQAVDSKQQSDASDGAQETNDAEDEDDDDELMAESDIFGIKSYLADAFGDYSFLAEAESEEKDDGEEEEEGDNGEEEEEGDNGEEEEEGDDADEIEDGDDAEEGEESEEAAEDGKNKKQEKTPGFFVVYKLQSPGKKEHKLTDTLKQFGSTLLGGIVKNFGLRFINGWGDYGSTMSFKDIGDNFGKVFGDVDLENYVKAIQTRIERKFPEAIEYAKVSYWDQKVVLKYCRRWLTGKDIKLIRQVPYLVCIKFNKRDKAPDLFTKSVIAEIANASIGNLLKKIKSGISKNDIIFIKNYDDNLKDRKSNIYDKSDDINFEERTPDGVDESRIGLMEALFGEFDNRYLFEEDPHDQGSYDHHYKVVFKYFKDHPDDVTDERISKEGHTAQYVGEKLEVATVYVGKGEKADPPLMPEIKGYKFKKWITSPPGHDLDSVKSNMDAYAKFEKDEDGDEYKKLIQFIDNFKDTFIKRLDDNTSRISGKHQFTKTVDFGGKKYKPGDDCNIKLAKQILADAINEQLKKNHNHDKFEEYVKYLPKSMVLAIISVLDIGSGGRIREGKSMEYFMYIIPVRHAKPRLSDDQEDPTEL